MNQTMTAPSSTALSFVLTPPEVVTPVVNVEDKAGANVPADRRKKIDEQVAAFIGSLMNEDVRSDAFRTRLDQAFSVGRKEIADSTALTNAFTGKNFVGETDTPAYQAISEMRTLFDELNPAKQGDLFTPTKFMGITVPFGNKLTKYLRKYDSANNQINALYEHITRAKDEVQKGVTELGLVRQKIFDGITNLSAAEYFITVVDEKVSKEVEALRITDANRAKALDQEVLYYVRQNAGDVLASKALAINAYNVCGELRKTGRETLNGCDRTATLGMSALTVAVTLARATGVQIKTMEMLAGSKKSIEDLIVSTGSALNEHVQRTVEFSSNPILGVETLQTMFDQTFSAMNTMETFRSQALASMKTNNDMLRGQLQTQMTRISSERQAVGAIEGIVL